MFAPCSKYIAIDPAVRINSRFILAMIVTPLVGFSFEICLNEPGHKSQTRLIGRLVHTFAILKFRMQELIPPKG